MDYGRQEPVKVLIEIIPMTNINLLQRLLCLTVLAGTTCSPRLLQAETTGKIDFNRDIRPVLSAKCFACHGPNAKDSDSEYRLDTKEGAFIDLGGYRGIIPGDLDSSEVYQRIISDDEVDQMPPPEHKNPLLASEVALLKRWIEQGAPYAGHWAFSQIEHPTPPKVQVRTTNGIDHFVARRLESEQLSFSSPANPETLFRRIYLDLTGLPPTLADLDRFLSSQEPKAYELAIDQLMETPAFAERLAMDWLDVARYADTNGYSIDDHRDMWGWRDWVIQAFLNNMPYDDFIRQQLAGDLIKDSSQQTQVATGFLRNSMNTHEGGTIAEEYRVAAIADKIDTVSTAFMGLTLKCAQCHSHKYDPISDRDYYRFFAFFNTSAEPGKGAVNGNTKPFLEIDPILQTADQFRDAVEQRIAALEFLKTHPEDFLGNARKVWEEETLAKAGPVKIDAAALAASLKNQFPVPKQHESKGLSWIWANETGSGEFAWFRKSFSLEKIPEQVLLYVSCDNEAEIWINGKWLGKNPDWRTPSVFDLRPLLSEGENVLAIAGKDWVRGGAKAALVAAVAMPNREYLFTDESWRVSDREIEGWNRRDEPDGFRQASLLAAHGSAPWGDTFASLSSSKANIEMDALVGVLRKPDNQRSLAEQDQVASAFAKANGEMSKLINAINGEIGVLRKSLSSGKTTVMVMDQTAANRKTPILIRGQYDQHGEVVEPGIPEVFGDLPEGSIRDRLALANWLTDPANPLTARVTVNRYWQLLFGTGLVKTTEDFGSQGEFPSHPELLDWLASEFIASGWDVRALLKTMLLSRTYRQSSVVSRESWKRDPYNRLLARAPRYRLSAESLRDGALTIGGLLDRSLGGPSVYPPQPKGLWKEVSHFGHPTFFTAQHFFRDETVAQIYRRSLYTFWKRTSPPPVMMAFDAPNRETCSVRRTLTNTPIQALVLMNEPQFVEASRGLAQRMSSVDGTVEDKIRFGFRLATSRYPSVKELEILNAAYRRQSNYFSESRSRITNYLGEKAEPSVAALCTVASLILNLDETITRE